MNLKMKRLNNGTPVFVIYVIIFMFAAAALLLLSRKAYEVRIDGKAVCYVKNRKEVIAVLEDFKKAREDKLKVKVDISSDVDYKTVFISKSKTVPVESIKKELMEKVKLTAEVYTISVDGKDTYFFKDRASADKVLNSLKERYLKDLVWENVKEVGFKEDVKVEKKALDVEELSEPDKVLDEILAGGTVEQYTVEKGDTISGISEKQGVSQDVIKKANPGLDIDRIQIGQVINLSVPEYKINVKVVASEIREEKIPFETIYEDTNDLYVGETKVKTEGKEGKENVFLEVVYINGFEEESREVNKETIEKPTRKVVLRGKKPRPTSAAYGSFINPSRGTLTSRFGQRGSELHTGIDIASATGTDIKAADGGKVTFAGWKGNYGKLVIIDHENGYETYYGHASSILVKVGQRVYRGQIIAKVGSTGRVTGPHLHFEVRRNGVITDPMKYVKY